MKKDKSLTVLSLAAVAVLAGTDIDSVHSLMDVSISDGGHAVHTPHVFKTSSDALLPVLSTMLVTHFLSLFFKYHLRNH